MTKSALQIARAAYQPKLPKALKGAVKVKEGEPTQSVADQEAIKALFPNTYGMPLIQFVEGEAVEMPAINVGVILSGGQAPGGHNVISGLFDGVKALNKDSKLYGFILGRRPGKDGRRRLPCMKGWHGKPSRKKTPIMSWKATACVVSCATRMGRWNRLSNIFCSPNLIRLLKSS